MLKYGPLNRTSRISDGSGLRAPSGWNSCQGQATLAVATDPGLRPQVRRHGYRSNRRGTKIEVVKMLVKFIEMISAQKKGA